MSLSVPDEKGFTLVEVLVAAVLLGVVLAGSLVLFGTASRAGIEARRQRTALALAQQKLEVVRGMPYSEVDSVSRTGCEPPFDEYACSLTVAEDVSQTIKTVTVTVYYRIGRSEKHVSLTTEKVFR